MEHIPRNVLAGHFHSFGSNWLSLPSILSASCLLIIIWFTTKTHHMEQGFRWKIVNRLSALETSFGCRTRLILFKISRRSYKFASNQGHPLPYDAHLLKHILVLSRQRIPAIVHESDATELWICGSKSEWMFSINLQKIGGEPILISGSIFAFRICGSRHSGHLDCEPQFHVLNSRWSLGAGDPTLASDSSFGCPVLCQTDGDLRSLYIRSRLSFIHNLVHKNVTGTF
ncbi:unnamed protein product [Victoria cruziana]